VHSPAPLWTVLDRPPGLGPDDPVPVVQATENLEGRPRVTYHLTTEELDWLEARLQEAGLADVGLAPRRVRADAWS
jgi:hypothetical protein